jgi:hypothetical protein
VSENQIAPSPMLDRQRVAEAIRRGVRLDLHPVIAKAATRGMTVELNEEQALAVADVTLAALVKAHPIDGKAWLIKANEDWQARNKSDELRYRALLAIQRQATDRWRGTALSGWVFLLGFACKWEWHWPFWSAYGVIVGGLVAGAGLRQWLLRSDRRKADKR